ncbi:hypothetical protein [Armatimonas rosea]|uniref:Outer membrane protein beta-barrel domain-containing protein n=1 Tax=Armatimonas rosea TaxID=685828 RepID=A0A7W9SMM5_ARMRO|nr:hypothetical protein [Armatimonas rosea]MBB6049150.1 hypothetical protein [Armatimonas rosea]
MKQMILALSCLALTTPGWAQEGTEREGHKILLPQIQQVTLQGLYGENRLVQAAGNPLVGFTYSKFQTGDVFIGRDDDNKTFPVTSLHLPNFGWFVDILTGSRADTTLASIGLGGAVRLTSTHLQDGVVAKKGWYYGMGGGLYATRVVGARHTTNAGIGFRLFAGKDSSDGRLLEVGYSYRPGTQGIHPSGLTLGLGRRF